MKDVVDVLLIDKGCSWEKKEFIGNGKYGDVFLLCCDDGSMKCDYVLKVIKRKSDISVDSFKIQLLNEVDMQNIFSSLGYAPKVYRLSYCDHEAVIIMDKLDTDVSKYLASRIVDPSELLAIKSSFKSMIKDAFSKGFVHDDLNAGNLGLELDKNGMFSKALLLDFGKARMVESFDDIDDILEGIDMTFKYALNKKIDTMRPPSIEKRKKMKSRIQRRFVEDDDVFKVAKPIKKRGGMFDEFPLL
jgi:serine/threonine protein kinase